MGGAPVAVAVLKGGAGSASSVGGVNRRGRATEWSAGEMGNARGPAKNPARPSARCQIRGDACRAEVLAARAEIAPAKSENSRIGAGKSTKALVSRFS